MENLMKELFNKYTGVEITDYNKNILEYPISIEHLLYFILELEDNYKVPMISIIDSIQYSEFTYNNLLKQVSKG